MPDVRSASELSATRRAELAENGTQMAFPLSALGYREPDVSSGSYPYLPLGGYPHQSSTVAQ